MISCFLPTCILTCDTLANVIAAACVLVALSSRGLLVVVEKKKRKEI